MTTIRVADIVSYKGETYRVKHHLKRVEDTFGQSKPVTIEDEIIYDILSLELLNEKLAREEKGLPHTRRYRLLYCRQHEATHLALYGLTYPRVPISECEFVEEVDWPAERIAEVRVNAESEFWLKNEHIQYWHWE